MEVEARLREVTAGERRLADDLAQRETSHTTCLQRIAALER